MLNTKEFYEILDSFEKTAKKTIRVGNQGFRRENKELWASQIYYVDGVANDAFKMFLLGYSCGRCAYMN